MKTKKSNITTLDEILDTKYGEIGAKKREQWEQEFEAFKLGVLQEETKAKKSNKL
jgi:HTH-type transcriptional regulator / antitoxin HipB